MRHRTRGRRFPLAGLAGLVLVVVVGTAVAADPSTRFGDPATRPGDPPRPGDPVRPREPIVVPTLIFTVTSRWVGATPYRLERDLTAHFEQALKTLPDVRQIRSTTLGGRAQTDITFDGTADASRVASAIRTRLDQIKTRLPRGATPPLITWRRDPPLP